MDKNFKYDIDTNSLFIGNIILNPKTKQENIKLFGYEYCNDFQDKNFYTLIQRLLFKDKIFKLTVVFKSDKIWLIEIKFEKEHTDNLLFNELKHEFLSANITWTKNIDLTQDNLLRLEFFLN